MKRENAQFVQERDGKSNGMERGGDGSERDGGVGLVL